MLVQVTKAKRTKTWLVKGKVYLAYKARGGPRGSLGVPVEDTRCGLPESGCLQTFTRGTVYASGAGTATSSARGPQGDVIAAARTQVGYVQGGTRANRAETKFQAWAGSKAAWCSIYVAWSANRAGQGDVIPKHKDFLSEYRPWARSLKRIYKPRPGALVIMNGAQTMGHAGLIAEVSANGRTFTMLDGNWNMRVRQTTQTTAGKEIYWPW